MPTGNPSDPPSLPNWNPSNRAFGRGSCHSGQTAEKVIAENLGRKLQYLQPGYELLTTKYFPYFKNSSLGVPSKRIVVLCFLSFLLFSSLLHSRMAPTLLLKATQSIDELFFLPADLGKS